MPEPEQHQRDPHFQGAIKNPRCAGGTVFCQVGLRVANLWWVLCGKWRAAGAERRFWTRGKAIGFAIS